MKGEIAIKIPLRYQATEYDCGTTSIINAITYLYEREEIPPYLLYNIMKYTLDEFSPNGDACKGTSAECMIFLAHWINSFARTRGFDISCEILEGEEANLENEKVENTLKNGGVIIPRVWQTCEHYVVITKIENEKVYLFDPYYLPITEYDNDNDVEIVKFRELQYNRMVSIKRVNSNSQEDYAIINNVRRIILLVNRVSQK